MWCDVMWCDVMWCDVMWCDVMWCDVMWCDVMWCDVMWCDVMRCDVMWCDVMRCDAMWCDVMWCDVHLYFCDFPSIYFCIISTLSSHPSLLKLFRYLCVIFFFVSLSACFSNLLFTYLSLNLSVCSSGFLCMSVRWESLSTIALLCFTLRLGVFVCVCVFLHSLWRQNKLSSIWGQNGPWFESMFPVSLSDMIWCDVIWCDVTSCDVTWCGVLCCDVTWRA